MAFWRPMVALGCAAITAFSLSGCASVGLGVNQMSERECMMRVMYFESNRSSRDGMLAVGTVVMNRKGTAGFPSTVCGVVGQKGQFAAGILSKPMKESRSVALVAQVADEVLHGTRHPEVRNAKFFHTAGLHFGYSNMHHVLVAGGNAFYEKW